MLLGATTRCFGGMSIPEVARLFKSLNLSVCELCFCHEGLSGWRYNMCTGLELPDRKAVAESVDILRQSGVEVSCIGIYSRFFGGTKADFCGVLSSFCDYMDIALSCGIKTVCTHGGIAKISGARTEHLVEEYRNVTVQGLCDALVEAKKMGINVALELTMHDIFCGYRGYLELSRYIYDYVGDISMLKYIASSCDDQNADIAESDISMYRLKDISTDGRYYERIGVGKGNSVSFLKRHSDCRLPMLLEYVNSTNFGEAVSFVEKMSVSDSD